MSPSEEVGWETWVGEFSICSFGKKTGGHWNLTRSPRIEEMEPEDVGRLYQIEFPKHRKF